MPFLIAVLSFYFVFSLAEVTIGIGLQPSRAASRDEQPSDRKKPPTASDQSGSEADRKITQQIRQGVVKDDSLSTSAQNVKIITQDGKVTLRGSVKSEEEKQKIADKAKKASGVKNVENLITVDK